MKFSIFQDSRIGGRSNNEDRLGYRYTREALVMVVADGLGGHGHGEVAAEAAVRSIIASFDRQAAPRLADPAAFLAEALAGAHSAILAQSGIRHLEDLPRTTCVVCVIQDGVARWGHSGDSRLYLLRHGRVVARTRDHAHLSPASRHVLTSCLGGDYPPRLDYSERTPLQHGDVLLLCTDGVWGPLPDEELLAALSLGEIAKAGPAFLDRIESLAGPGRDNLSLIALTWTGASPTPGWTEEDFARTLNTTHTRLHATDSKDPS